MKLDVDKIKVGGTVCLQTLRRSRELTVKEVVVTKVGRKYITVKDGLTDIQFHIEDGREKTDYSSNYRLFADIREYEEVKYRKEIHDKLMAIFLNSGNSRKFIEELSIEDLKEIEKMIDKTLLK